MPLPPASPQYDSNEEGCSAAAAVAGSGAAGASSAAAAAEPSPAGDPAGWRVGEIKQFLGQRGVDMRGCLEKGHLVELCRAELAATEGEAGAAEEAGQGAAAAAREAAPPAKPAAADAPAPERRCAGCGAGQQAGGPKLRRCAGCGAVRYCSEACQRQAWPAHRRECRRLGADSAAAAADAQQQQ